MPLRWGWWLVIAAIVFLALWGWRELGMRASRERIAQRDAEIQQLQQENDQLRAQLGRVTQELTIGNMYNVAAPANVSARVLLDPQQRAFVVVLAPRGSYDFAVNGQNVARIDVPKAGQKTMMLNHLPPQSEIKSFTLTAH